MGVNDYSFTWSDTTKTPLTVLATTKDSTSTSLLLTGRGSPNWGRDLQENLIWLLENFASSTPPAHPVEGQTWYDQTAKVLKVYAKNSSNVPTWTTLLIGNQTITVTGDVAGSGTTAIALTLPTTGVAAGTYKSVQVDTKGRVVAGANPTTLAGYGITDALSNSNPTVSGSITLNSTTPVIIMKDTDSLVGAMQNYISFKDSSNSEVGWVGFGQGDGTLGINNGARNITLLSPVVLSNGITGSGANLSGLNASNLSTGTVAATLLPNSGVAAAVYGSQYQIPVITVDAKGRVTNANTILVGATTLTGDVTGSGTGSFTTTLAASGVTAGTYGSTSNAVSFAIDAKGRITSASQGPIAAPWSGITGKPTTLSGYGITDAQPALGWTPVQQGGGIGQLNNKIYIGWSAFSKLKVTVDSTDLGNLATESWVASNFSASNITVTGDVTGTGPASNLPLTLAASGVTPGTYGSSTVTPVLNVDAKGRVIGANFVTSTPSFANISGKPTTVAGFGITDAVTSAGGLPLGSAGGYNTDGRRNNVTLTLEDSGKIIELSEPGYPQSTATLPTIASVPDGTTYYIRCANPSIIATGGDGNVIRNFGVGSSFVSTINLNYGTYVLLVAGAGYWNVIEGHRTQNDTGRLIFQSAYTSGSGSHAFLPQTQFAIIEIVGGGGGSGGVEATAAGQYAAASSGAPGAYGKFRVNISAGDSATYSVGDGGTAGTSAPTTGGNGGSTSIFAHTVSGGKGSSSGAAKALSGGTYISPLPNGTNSTFGTFIITDLGNGGNPSFVNENGTGWFGKAPMSALGESGAGAPATIHTGSAAAASGSAGGNGKIIIWEYS